MNIIESIKQEPEKWKQTECTFNHENGARIWTANLPILNPHMYPGTYMGLWMKIKIWWAIRSWAGTAPIDAFGRKSK